MQLLQADTAVDVRIGPFVDVGDGFTPEIAIGNTPTNLTGVDEAELLKHDGAATTDITSNTWAAVSGCDGWYDLTLTASNTDTEGQLTVVIQDDTVCLPVFAHFMVINEAAWGSLFTTKATGYMDINVKAVSEDTVAADNLESACDNYSATRGLSGTALPAVAAGGAGGLPTDSTGKTSFNDVSTAEVNTEVDNGIVTYGLDHLVQAAVTGTDITDNSIIAKLVSNQATADWDDFVNTTDSLQAIRDWIGDGTNLAEAGGTGDHLTAINLPNQTMDITGSLSGSVGSVTGAVGSVTGSVGSVAAGGITSGSFAAGAINAAAIATDAIDNDALAANAISEFWAEAMVDLAAGAPSATASVLVAINYLYEAWRNKTVTNGTTNEIELYKDDAITKLCESDISDDGTDFTKGEYGAVD
ncbi:MAG: hypothetical protein ACXABY_07375 [Candidatus Thorarchaeota archaeon]|jgi:hypothetical protein